MAANARMTAMADAVLATVFSPCGKFVVCATAFGWVHLWRVAVDGTSIVPSLFSSFRAHHAALYTLIFVGRGKGHLLFSGAEEEIRGWNWEELLSSPQLLPEPIILLQNPRQPERRGALGQLTDTAAFAFDDVTGLLYSAAGDGNSYAWDLEKLTTSHTLVGFGDPLYCLATRPAHKQVTTASSELRRRFQRSLS